VRGTDRPLRAGKLLLDAVRGAHFQRVRTLWSAEVVSVAALVVSGLVVARALGPETYGRFALLSAFGALVFSVFEPRVGEVVTKYFGTAVVQGRHRDARTILKGTLALDAVAVAVAVAVVLTVAAQPWVQGLAPGTVLDLALAAGSVALAGPVLTGRAALAVLDRYRTFARIQTVAGLGRAAGAAVAAVATRDVTAVLAVLVVSTVAELVADLLAVRRAVAVTAGRQPGESRTRLADFRSAAPGVGRFLAYSEATTLLASVTKSADTLIVGGIAGAEQAGLYRLARSLTTPVGNLVTPLQTVAYNRFVAVFLQGGAARVRLAARRATVTAVPLAVLLALACFLVPPAVRLLAGDEFSGAGPVAVVLLLGAAVGLPLYWLRSAYLVLDRLRTWLWVSVVISIVSTVGFVLGAELGGALGVAAARALLVTLIANLVLLVLLKVRPGSPAAPLAARPL
jgi:O-antigen/teichoic acid export membrane protein